MRTDTPNKFELGDIVRFNDRVFVVIGYELNHGDWQYELCPYDEQLLEFALEEKIEESEQ